MFEQSIVLEHAGARRAGALATSLMAQIAAAGVLIIAPLLYNEVLPSFRPLSALPPYLVLKPLPQDTVRASSDSRPSQMSPSPVRVFRAPTQINKLDTSPTMIQGEPELTVAGPVGPPGGVDLSGIFSPTEFARVAPAPVAKPVVATPKPSTPIRVSEGASLANLIHKVVPVYPPLARQARVSGTVRLQGIIAKDGTIQQLQVLSGHPMLTRAALDAVRQWVYRPMLLNGDPVEVITGIDVIFTLSQ
jgi:protein TonB